MKQCTNCGAWAQPNDQFCLQCGTMLCDTTSPIARAKKVCGSPLLLIAAILFTVYLVINIASIVMSWLINPMSVVYALDQIFVQAGLSSFDSSEMEFFMILIGLLQVLGQILPFLMACGLWLFYTACKKKPADAPAKTGGLTMLKVGPIMSLIGGFTGVILMGILTLLVFIAAIGTGETAALIAAIVMLVLCVVFVLMIIYYFGVMKTISAVKSAVTTGKRGKRVSMYVIVWNFIILIYNIVMIALNVMALSFVSAFTLLLYTAAMFLLTISTLLYRSKVEKTLEPAFPTAQDYPVYTQQPQYAPAQPYPQYAQPTYNAPQSVNNQYNQQNTYGQYNQQPVYQPQQPAYPAYEEPVQPQYPAYEDTAQPEENAEPIGPENVDA